MAKKIIVNTEINNNNLRIGFTIFQSNGDYKHSIITSQEYLNLTIASCSELVELKFRNIVIDFDFEHPRFIQFAPIDRTTQNQKYYIIATKYDNNKEVMQTNLIGDLLIYLNSYTPGRKRLFKRFEIVHIK